MSMTDFTALIDLAAERLGGAVLAANDEFFAPKEGLIKASAPEWREGLYTERGKWMDGWETRRRRDAGEDWAIIKLGAPGIVRGVVIDTSFYTGNYPESASVEGCAMRGTPSVPALLSSDTPWSMLLPRTPIVGDAANLFAIPDSAERVTHLRLTIHPDGGVARLRVHGQVVADVELLAPGDLVDVAAVEHGGFVVVCSDMHYGHRQNLIMPGRATHMGDGWETKRRRGPGHEWTIVRLAQRAALERVELDTDHFRGNAPGACSIDYCDVADGTDLDAAPNAWSPLLPHTPLQPHARFRWTSEVAHQTATHVRLNIFPDGGVARLRVFGRLTAR